MCGIAGLLHLDGAPANPDILQRMTRILAHRGPDGEDLWHHGAAGLGHRRLSIVDLSANGTQPMSNEDGTVWITYNGEIYNHAVLRRDLEAKGHVFRSLTDTEAIIHGYEEYGVEVLQWLNGMFAFAIYDTRQQTLFLARDRIGIKPLFYGVFEDTLLFGSEVKALLQHPITHNYRQLDPIALDLYLSLNYTPAPYTMFQAIRQVLPGHYMQMRVGEHQAQQIQYWDVDYRHTTDLSEADATQKFEALLHTAVERRLMADVPLGAFLSGGVDSSAVVACMTDLNKGRVKTFSMGFGEKSFNEAPYAKTVADHLQTEHYEKIVTPDLATILPKVVWHGEDPLGDSSMIPVYYLAQMTREQVTVALAGDGADEILAGYPTYIATDWARRLEFVPQRVMQSILQPLLQAMPVSDAKVSWREKMNRFAAGIGLPWQDAHAVWRQIHTPQQKQAIVQSDWRNGGSHLFATYQHYYRQSYAQNRLDNLLYVDTRFYLPNDMLVKVDRMTMAHGLEARVPFLDHELVEFAATLPPHYKLRNGVGKYILRQVMANKLPAVTLNRKKEGFNIPVAKWLRGELSELLHDTLTPQNLNAVGVWKVDAIQKMLGDHRQKKQDYGYQLWGLLTFMIWWEQFAA